MLVTGKVAQTQPTGVQVGLECSVVWRLTRRVHDKASMAKLNQHCAAGAECNPTDVPLYAGKPGGCQQLWSGPAEGVLLAVQVWQTSDPEF
jgi:hypothetical protein